MSDITNLEQEVLENLSKNIVLLHKSIEKQMSAKRAFFLSVVQGVGSVIGATILAGIVLFVLSKFIVSAEQIPFIGKFIKDTNIEKSINSKINTSQPNTTTNNGTNGNNAN